MVREIRDHKVNEVNDGLDIFATDEPGHGGANHAYQCTWTRKDGTPGAAGVIFQNGTLRDEGVNGVTHEALLAIVADRLRAFQAGQFACRENALALTKIEEAMHWLHARTRARVNRGVEGQHKV